MISESAISVSVSWVFRVRGTHVAVKDRDEALGLDELDAVVGAEVAALVLPPVDIARGMALLGIDNERLLPLGQLAVGQDVDTLVTNQPETGLFALAGAGAVIRIAEPAIGCGIGDAPFDDLPHGQNGKCEHLPHLTPQYGSAGAADVPAAWPGFRPR